MDMNVWMEYLRMYSQLKNNERIKKNVKKSNMYNKRIQEYRTSEIEGFITKNDIYGRLVISGGSSYIRNRAINEYCIYAYNNNIPVIILHKSNSELANEISSLFSQVYNYTVIDSSSMNYNPFMCKNPDEVIQLIKIATCNCKEVSFNANAFEYLIGISLLINNITGNVPFDMFAPIPYNDVFDKIKERTISGALSINEGDAISSRLLKGQQEQSVLENYFKELSSQGKGLFADISNRKNSVSLSALVKKSHISIIDIKSDVNTLLLNIIIGELLQLISSNSKFILVLSEIDMYGNELLKKILHSNTSNWLISSEDLFPILGSDEKEFTFFTNMASKVLIMAHRNNKSAEQWSNYLGEYEEAKISESNNLNYCNNVIFQKPLNTLTVSTSKEKRVPTSTISKMSDNEIFVNDNTTGELKHARLK